ncbi:conserved Plasmodium protein, unknown function [Plasmodium ovale]|uniref:Uncharacterized protein n=1 Tax=Plasmodium ovale TaxID=36330 RepID=A0A1D3U8P9_PLAOA|nr:conserved Plasmodium protein, unknown function [Plasmodium ovale]
MRNSSKKKQDILWGKKWRNLIQQKAIKEEMNKKLKESLEKQKQEEEEKECTFKPQTLWNQSFKKTISFVDDFFIKLKPYIEQQQAYLNHLKELEQDDKTFSHKIKEELRMMLSKAIDKEIMETIIEGYKGVRTRGMNKVKREKLDILSKMIKLEREYNCFMARENVDKKDLEECGFDCDLAAKLRNDILKDSLCPNSLRDFAKIRQEINQVLEEELRIRENEKDITSKTNKENYEHSERSANDILYNEKEYTYEYDETNDSEGISVESTHTNGNTIVGNKNSQIEDTFERVKYNFVNDNNRKEIIHENRNGGKVSGEEYFLSQGCKVNRVGNPNGEQIVHYHGRGYLQKTRERDRVIESGKSKDIERGDEQGRILVNANTGWEYTNPPKVNTRMDIIQNGGEHEKKMGNNSKNVYLNSNYMKILKSEDANKYMSSLKKDLNPVNVIILNGGGGKEESGSGGNNVYHGDQSVYTKFGNTYVQNTDRIGNDRFVGKNAIYINENNINSAGNSNQGQKTNFMQKNVVSHHRLNLGGNVIKQGHHQTAYLPHHTKNEQGDFPHGLKYILPNAMNNAHTGERVASKHTRYIDKDACNVKKPTALYSNSGSGDRSGEMPACGLRPYYASDTGRERQQIASLMNERKGVPPDNVYFSRGEYDTIKGYPCRPLFSKMTEKTPIH